MNKEEFDSYIEKLKKEYREDPKKTINFLRESMIKLDNSKNNNLIYGVDKDIVIMVVLITIIVLIGLINISSSYLFYLMGIVFFLSGIFIGFNEKGFGLIFLFSHGFSGLCLMIGSQIYDVINNPLLHDNAYNVWIYMGIGVLLIISAFLIAVFINLSDNLRHNYKIKNIVFSILVVVLFMSALLPHILYNLYSFSLF